MAVSFYSKYAAHCMKFYARYSNPAFKSEVDRKNWQACDKALKNFTAAERDALTDVYRENDTFSDNVYSVSRKYGIEQDRLWALVIRLERYIAYNLDLI